MRLASILCVLFPLFFLVLLPADVANAQTGIFSDDPDDPDVDDDVFNLDDPPAPERRSRTRRVVTDPVAKAFALPEGMVLTAEEMKWAMGIRQQLEPRYRSALEQVKNAESSDEKMKAVKEIRAIEAQIKSAIGAIIQQRQMKVMQEMAKRAAEARKKAAEHRKKSNNHKRGSKKRRR